MRCYRLVSSRRDKLVVWAEGGVMEAIVLSLASYLLFSGTDFSSEVRWFVLPSIVLGVLVPGPLILVDGLIKAVCVSDVCVSLVSAVQRHGIRPIQWHQINEVRVYRDGMDGRSFRKVVIYGRYPVRRLQGIKWIPTSIAIPGHIPDIEEVLGYCVAPCRIRFPST